MLNEKKLGKCGQITIPVHIRREMGIEPGEKFAIEQAVDGSLLLKRVTGSCVLCGGHEELVRLDDKYLCRGCILRAQALVDRD